MTYQPVPTKQRLKRIMVVNRKRAQWAAERGPSARPSPLFDVLPQQEVRWHRELWCRRYDGCLDYAAAAEWRSWSCQHCTVIDPYSAAEREHMSQRTSGRSNDEPQDALPGKARG